LTESTPPRTQDIQTLSDSIHDEISKISPTILTHYDNELARAGAFSRKIGTLSSKTNYR